MARVLQLRRGTSADHATFTGAIGEVTFDTTDTRLVAHDGVTAGGIPLAKESEITGAATTSASGIVELSTDAEAIAKADTGRVMTPSNLAALGSSATFAGLVELATDAETKTGTDTARATTPANVAASHATGVIGSVSHTYTTSTNITTVIPLDDTIPQVTEGVEINTVSITPKTTSSKLRARWQGVISNAAVSYSAAALFVDGAANAVRATYGVHNTGSHPVTLSLEYEWSPATTSAVTVSVRVGPTTAGTIRANGNSSARYFGGVMGCVLVVEEIAA